MMGDNMQSALSFLQKALPWIGAAATGNIPALIGLAAAKISDVTGKPVDATPDAIVTAVAGATPEQILSLKKADQDFALQMQALGFKQVTDLEALAAGDRASARSMQTIKPSPVPAVLTLLITIGFFGVLFWMLNDPTVANSPPLLIMLGSLGTAWSGACAFWFGTTRGSQQKDQLLADSVPVK